MSENLYSSVNQHIANFSVLYEKLHHYHWFVKGPSFFTLHEKFQEDYEQTTEFVDELAERLIQIGGTPVSTLSEYLKLSSIEENQKLASHTTSMVEQLVSDYRQIVFELKNTISLAGLLEDSVTEDLCIGISAAFEKKIWLYEAFLTK